MSVGARNPFGRMDRIAFDQKVETHQTSFIRRDHRTEQLFFRQAETLFANGALEGLVSVSGFTVFLGKRLTFRAIHLTSSAVFSKTVILAKQAFVDQKTPQRKS